MNFLKDVPDIIIMQNDASILGIETVISFKEDENAVTLICAEYVSQFRRGFVCDMELEFRQYNDAQVRLTNIHESVKNLVLVYINKESQMNSVPEIRYIFYK